jgi:hypothetical protein
MDRLNDLAPAIGGLGMLAFIWYTYFRIKREQARARAKRDAAAE